MKAAVLREVGKPLQIEQVQISKPGPHEVLIRTAAAGLCHSDLHFMQGSYPHPLPAVLGHESAGVVEQIGSEVRTVKVGDHVITCLSAFCGHCEFCLAGMETICKQAEATGYTKPGGYAEYLVAPAAFVGRLPQGTDPYAMAPILCAGVTTYRGLKRTGARPGQWVAVVGIGGLGHIAIQYARAMGLRVAAVDVSEEKLALAKSLGAELTVNGAETDPAAALQEKIGGTHAAVVTAVAPRAFEQAVLMLRPGGTVAYIGLPGGKADEIRASISAIVNGELSVRGSNVGTRQDLDEAVAFAARGLVKATIRTVALEEINDVLDEMRKGRIVGRVVLKLA